MHRTGREYWSEFRLDCRPGGMGYSISLILKPKGKWMEPAAAKHKRYIQKNTGNYGLSITPQDRCRLTIHMTPDVCECPSHEISSSYDTSVCRRTMIPSGCYHTDIALAVVTTPVRQLDQPVCLEIYAFG
jgi:hypothetical protein